MELKDMVKEDRNQNYTALLRLLRDSLYYNEDTDICILIESDEREYEIKDVTVHQQVDISNNIQTLITIKI